VVEAALSPRRRGLTIIWLLLGALTVGIGALEWTDHLRARSGGADPADPRLLLPVPPGELGAIEIADAGRVHRFERDATGAWFYHGAHGVAEGAHTHDPDPARAERIARAFAALGRARAERDFPLGRDAATYGVASPELVILVYRPGQSQPLAQYAVGHVAPDTASRYVTVVGRPVVMTIPAYQIDNLRELIRTMGAAPEPSRAIGPAPR
jgi:uncharacterized protein DUF4340